MAGTWGIRGGTLPDGKEARAIATDDLIDRIEVNPKVMRKPVIKGTRIPVEVILRKLGEGATVDDLLDAYPHLCREDIRAALAYAAKVLAHEETVAI